MVPKAPIAFGNRDVRIMAVDNADTGLERKLTPDGPRRKLASNMRAEDVNDTLDIYLCPVDVHRRRMTVATIAMKAEKLLSVLQQHVAIPWNSLSFPKKF